MTNKDALPSFEAYVIEDALPERVLAIVRLTWLDDNGRTDEIQEFALYKNGVDPKARLRSIISGAKRAGADVAVILGCSPKDLGFKDV